VTDRALAARQTLGLLVVLPLALCAVQALRGAPAVEGFSAGLLLAAGIAAVSLWFGPFGDPDRAGTLARED